MEEVEHLPSGGAEGDEELVAARLVSAPALDRQRARRQQGDGEEDAVSGVEVEHHDIGVAVATRAALGPGEEGLTEGVVAAVDAALAAGELVEVSLRAPVR